MNTRLQTDVWIYGILVMLGFILVASVIITIALAIMSQPVLEIIVALGTVAAGGLARLLVSPLNQEL